MSIRHIEDLRKLKPVITFIIDHFDEIAKEIGADSLSFISIDGLYRAMGEARRDPDCPQFCDACFTGDYPITLATGLSAKRVSHGVIN